MNTDPSSSSPPLMTPPWGMRPVAATAAGLLVVLCVLFGALVLAPGRHYDTPSGMRAPGTPSETQFARRLEQQGNEVAYYTGDRVAVFVPEAEWKALGRSDRFARQRFLSDTKSQLDALEREHGDRTAYRMSVRSRETQRILAEETDFNPRIYD